MYIKHFNIKIILCPDTILSFYDNYNTSKTIPRTQRQLKSTRSYHNKTNLLLISQYPSEIYNNRAYLWRGSSRNDNLLHICKTMRGCKAPRKKTNMQQISLLSSHHTTSSFFLILGLTLFLTLNQEALHLFYTNNTNKKHLIGSLLVKLLGYKFQYLSYSSIPNKQLLHLKLKSHLFQVPLKKEPQVVIYYLQVSHPSHHSHKNQQAYNAPLKKDANTKSGKAKEQQIPIIIAYGPNLSFSFPNLAIAPITIPMIARIIENIPSHAVIVYAKGAVFISPFVTKRKANPNRIITAESVAKKIEILPKSFIISLQYNHKNQLCDINIFGDSQKNLMYIIITAITTISIVRNAIFSLGVAFPPLPLLGSYPFVIKYRFFTSSIVTTLTYYTDINIFGGF